MGGLFSRHHGHGRKPKVLVTDHDRAVLDLKIAKDKLKRYQIKMRSESIRLTEQAKELVAVGRKDRALLVLKMRRLREDEQVKAESQLMNMEQLITQIEWETQQMQVFDALKSGNQALDAIHEIMSLEEVEKLMADTADSIEYEQEVSRLLSGSLSAGAEEEVMMEFEELQALTGLVPDAAAPFPVTSAAPAVTDAEAPPMAAEEKEAVAGKPSKAPQAGTLIHDLPDVPTHEPVVKPLEKEEEVVAAGAAVSGTGLQKDSVRVAVTG
ncbi:charged multivesicular body protein 6 [Nannochloropsis oceanica]